MDKKNTGRERVNIEHVQPEIDGGRVPIKRVAGEKVVVQADIFTDGHDVVCAQLLYRRSNDRQWDTIPMHFLVNDRWQAEFVPTEAGKYIYTLKGWVDHFKSWQRDLKKKFDAGQDVRVDLLIGAEYIKMAAKRAKGADARRLMKITDLLTQTRNGQEAVSITLGKELSALLENYPNMESSIQYDKELYVVVDRQKALFSTWYERFPRSCSSVPGKHGTLADCEGLLPEIARMGFDVLYLPPIHPIGKTNKKGKNNIPEGKLDDPGSPWAIGSEEGGHMAIHPQLGTLKDFDRLVLKAKEYGVEVAMDLAYQCSPDHPYVKEHPEWFRWRPDGTVQYAENPPKKYQDILPIYFETENWEALWEELKNVVLFWIQHGIRIFRVDNPHTKPFSFWEWLISQIKEQYPDVIFLSEAFTRPKVMYRLAKLGFTQSYTYFTWRTSKHEITSYLTELTQTEVREVFRPNFWPNTPDILPEHLQYGGRPAFLMRLVLAATLSSNYGIYGPAFELCLHEPRPGVEEYNDNEKYEIKTWNWDELGNLKDFIARINHIRKENSALQTTWNVNFYELHNDHLIAYGKASEDHSNLILVVVNLDPHHTQSGWVRIPLDELGIDPVQSFLAHDLLSNDKYIWQGEWNYIELNPQKCPAHIFQIRSRLKREMDFDYFM